MAARVPILTPPATRPDVAPTRPVKGPVLLNRPTNYPPSRLRVQDMKTYTVTSPLSTHWRPATCAEVACEQYLNGWRTVLDPATQAAMVATVKASGRKPSAVIQEAGQVTFVFEPGTPCFKAASHRKRLERPEFFVVRGGDHRAQTTPTYQHTRPEHWVEDLRTQTQMVIDHKQKG